MLQMLYCTCNVVDVMLYILCCTYYVVHIMLYMLWWTCLYCHCMMWSILICLNVWCYLFIMLKVLGMFMVC